MRIRRANLTAVLIAAGCLILVGRDLTAVRDNRSRVRPGSLTASSTSVTGEPRNRSTAVAVEQGRTGGSPTSVHRTVTDGRGTPRDFIVRVPAGYDGDKPLAVTFVFHGLNGKAADAPAYGIQNGTGAAEASLFVFPQGVAFENDGVGWDDTCGGYDMVFFDRMLADIEARYSVDGSKVFVAGFSWGGDFVTARAGWRGGKIRGVSAAAGPDEFRDTADYRTYANLACPVANRAAIRFTHDANGDSAYPAPLFATTSKLFQSMNACSSSAAEVNPGSCVSYAGCANRTVECVKPGIGHSPGPNWGAETWDFFSSLK